MTFSLRTPAPKQLVETDLHARARRATAAVFAAQGAAVAAVSTTVPAVERQLGLSPLTMTALTVALALAAGAGSFAGLAAVRRLGAVAVMRGAALVAAGALLIVGRAPDPAVATAGYLLLGLALGGIDVSANTRATAVELHYGRSIFASFYAAWSAAGVTGALLTAGMARLGWPVADVLTVHAALVAALALTVRAHRLAAPETSQPAAGRRPAPQGRGLWARLAPFGCVLLVAYVVDSTVSAWSTVYLHRTLGASPAAAPLAYAAYQVGTVTGRACGDRLVRRIGPAAVVRTATLFTAAALAGLAAAPGWPYAVLAAGCAGLGVAVLVPLCLASAGRLRPDAAEDVLARLNAFNYAGVLLGAGVSGALGATGLFRLAYAVPAGLALVLLTTARHFGASPGAASTRVGG